MHKSIQLRLLPVVLLVGLRTSWAQGVFIPPGQVSSFYQRNQEADSGRQSANLSFPITYLDKTPTEPLRPNVGSGQLATGLSPYDPAKDSLQFLRYIDSLALLRVTALRLKETNARKAESKRDQVLNRMRDVPSILPFYVSPMKSSGLVRTRMSSGFGMRQHPVLGSLVSHTGIDLPAPMGTLVYATADGFCRQIINQPEGIGLAIYLAHGRGHQTLYGHLLTTWVKPGDFVYRGQIIGRVGASGMTTGPHLHYGVRYNGQVVDPLPYCFLLSKPVQSASLTRK